MILRDGAVGRLATMLNAENRISKDEGTTDGQTTNLAFASEDDGFVKSIEGDFAGHAMKLQVMRQGTTPDGVPILRFKSQGGDVDVDVTSQHIMAPNSMATSGFRETGTIDGRPVDLTYQHGSLEFTGTLGTSPFELRARSEAVRDQPMIWDGATNADSSTTPDQTMHLDAARLNFHAGDFEVPKGQFVEGAFLGVPIEEHETGPKAFF